MNGSLISALLIASGIFIGWVLGDIWHAARIIKRWDAQMQQGKNPAGVAHES